MKKLLDENFSDFNIGHFPYDYTPFGEYHYIPPKGYRGRWTEPTNRGWRLGGHWLILEDDGEHLIEQTTNTDISGATGKHGYKSMIFSGDDNWENYVLEVELQSLLPISQTGVMFRYRTGRNYYALIFDEGNCIKLIKRDQDEIKDLAIAVPPNGIDCDKRYTFKIEVNGSNIKCFVDGLQLFDVEDDRYLNGKVGLISAVPARYYSVKVSCSDKEYESYLDKIQKNERELLEERQKYPQPELDRIINTKGFGCGRHIRVGDLTGDGKLDIIFAQNIKHHGIDLYSMITCLTAVDLNGNVLWQVGEPRDTEDAGMTTSDVAYQIYDIDGDGENEVIVMRNFKLYILEGSTGKVKKCIPTPKAELLTKDQCNKWPESEFHRINGDCIQICNFSGNEHPSDILIKNRYNHLWAYDKDLNLLWHLKGNTGHFPQPYDFNGDGKDELIASYMMISSDGEVIWDLADQFPELDRDHVDEIAIGQFDPNIEGAQIALTAGDEGFIIVDKDGNLLAREMLGHVQRASAAKYRDDLEGLQFYVVTYWDNPNIISLHDCKGKKLFAFEQPINGNLLNPVNWTGEGTELGLLSGNVAHGGMVDGYGRRVVTFPDDGHPEMCAMAVDMIGDERDEILLWDQEKMYIYTQDKDFKGDKIYSPIRYPHSAESNYRAEISLPNWKKINIGEEK